MVQMGRNESPAPLRLTPEFIARAEELDLHMATSGWGTTKDSALVDRGDQGPWLEVLTRGYSAMTDYPYIVLQFLSRCELPVP